MAALNDQILNVPSHLVVHVCPCFVDLNRETGGVANIVRQICLNLAALRKPTLLLCGNTELGKRVTLPHKKQISQFLSVEVFAQRRNPLLGPTAALRRRISELPQGAILHVHTCFSAFSECAMQTAVNLKIPFVFTPHGKLSKQMLRNRRLPKYIWWRLRTKALVRSATWICLSSRREAEAFRELGLDQGWGVIPNGFEPFDASSMSLDPGIREPYVLFLGYLDPRKQPEFLVRAFAASKVRHTHRLVFAGPDTYGHRAMVEDVAKLLGIQDRLVFTGHVSGAHKWALLRSADCLCLPSKAEGMPVVLAEALGANTPCIYSDACNFPELADAGAGIEMSGFVINEWVDALEKVCTGGDLRSQMCKAGSRLAPNYTWNAIAKKWMALYDSIGVMANG